MQHSETWGSGGTYRLAYRTFRDVPVKKNHPESEAKLGRWSPWYPLNDKFRKKRFTTPSLPWGWWLGALLGSALTSSWSMENRRTRSSCGPSCADPEQQHIRPFMQNTNDQNTSVAIVTSQKLFSSLRCLKEATMFVWKSFQRRQNCWSSAMVEWDRSICNKDQHLLFGHGTARTSCVPRFWFFSTQIVMKILLHFKTL